VDDHGYFVEPTVLTDTTPEMNVVREEIFGPVVCAIPFGGYKKVCIAPRTWRAERGRSEAANGGGPRSGDG
jgi:hypothetical protein